MCNPDALFLGQFLELLRSSGWYTKDRQYAIEDAFSKPAFVREF
jgi:hypothetical protein